jgi:hypothetical protein
MKQSLKNNQYPKTITEANNVLSNHHFNKTFNANRRHQDNKSKDKNKDKKDKEEAPETSFANIEGNCYCCSKGGYYTPACRNERESSKRQMGDKQGIIRRTIAC